MLSAQGAGKFTEGVILSRAWKCCSAPMPPSLYLITQTEPEKAEDAYQLMQRHGVSELDAA